MRRSCSAAIRMGNTPANPVPVASSTRWSAPLCEPFDEPCGKPSGKLPGAPLRQPSPGQTQAPSGPSNVSVSPGARRGRMPSVKTPPGMRRMWNSSRTGGRIALDDVRRGTARHRGARRSGARRCGDRSRGDRSQRVRRSGDRHIGDGEVASDAIFQQQLHMLSRQPGVGPRVLHFDDELRHAWRQRQARHHARAARLAAGPAPASAEMSGADRRPRGTGTSAARRRR